MARTATRALALVACAGAFGLIWLASNGWVALGVGVAMFANNLEQHLQRSK